MIESWDSGFCERVGVCAGLFFFCERGVRERDAREACAACRRGFVGGWLLGCRKSALFSKSPNSLRSNSELLKNNADFRQPRISTPPAESGDRQHTPHGLAFQGGRDRVAARELGL